MAGAAGQPKQKPYSLTVSPADVQREGWLELLVGVDDSGSAGPHLPLDAGTLVEIDGPLGVFTFPSNPVDERFLFIAGGTGIAPLRAMLHEALALPHREIGVLYSARTPQEFAYEAELRAL